MGGIFGAVSFLNITASDLSDQLLKDFLDMDSSQIVTMHIQSVDQNKAIKTIKQMCIRDRNKGAAPYPIRNAKGFFNGLTGQKNPENEDVYKRQVKRSCATSGYSGYKTSGE